MPPLAPPFETPYSSILIVLLGTSFAAGCVFLLTRPRPSKQPSPPKPEEDTSKWSWQSKGGRKIRVVIPKKLGKPKDGGPWAKEVV